MKIFSNKETRSKFPFRSLFLHAWDLHDDGLDEVMSWMRDSGLNTMCMAGTYHSGWFIHPHNSRHRAFMTEGSVCYFQPHKSLYAHTPLKPRVSSISKKRDWFAEAGKRLNKYNLRLVSWTVGTHNTRLGLAHPALTQQNVYGDRLPHALCPSNPEVREYLKALCRDLATNYPMWGIQLECFGWMGFSHGHHHERDLAGLAPFEQELMALCVCNACTQRARSASVDVGKVREVIRNTLDSTFREAPDRPKRHPKMMADLEGKCSELRKFNAWRKSCTDSLIIEVKQEALKGTECRLLLQHGYDPALAPFVDGFACGAYQQTPADVLKTCRAASKTLPRDWSGLFQCFIQLGMGVPKSQRQLAQIVESVAKGGCNGINFYNRSESPPKMLGWLKSAL